MKLNGPVLLRLVGETTFAPLLLGLWLLASAIQPSDAGFEAYLQKSAGCLLLAMVLWRRWADLDLRLPSLNRHE